jgi:anti-anti-sigma factor
MDSRGPVEDGDLVTVSTTSAKDVIWVMVRGEVDLSNRRQLRTSLAEPGRGSRVYLDLRLLRFCDSVGCRSLVRFERRAAAAGGEPVEPARPLAASRQRTRSAS